MKTCELKIIQVHISKAQHKSINMSNEEKLRCQRIIIDY